MQLSIPCFQAFIKLYLAPYSLAESLLLVASQDKKIYFLDTKADFQTKGILDCAMYYESILTGPQQPLLFDFSKSGKQIRVASGLNEDSMSVQYFDVTKPDVEMQKPATNLTTGMENEWSTMSVANAADFSAYQIPTEISSFYSADLTNIVTNGTFVIGGFSNGYVCIAK